MGETSCSDWDHKTNQVNPPAETGFTAANTGDALLHNPVTEDTFGISKNDLPSPLLLTRPDLDGKHHEVKETR